MKGESIAYVALGIILGRLGSRLLLHLGYGVLVVAALLLGLFLGGDMTYREVDPLKVIALVTCSVLVTIFLGGVTYILFRRDE